MKKIFSYNLLERALLRKNLSPFDFSKLAGITPSTISSWKRVKSIKKIACRDAIERILGVSYDSLCIPEEDTKRTIYSTDLEPPQLPTVKRFPIIGQAAGGPWISAIEEYDCPNYADEYMAVTASTCDECGYALRVVGDSMSPYLPDGTLIAVSPNSEPCNGDIVVAFIENEISPYRFDVCVKQYYWTLNPSEPVRLVSFNQHYKEIHIHASKLVKVHKVIQWNVRAEDFRQK